MTATERPTVLLVFGGKSSEHPVSCLTAASVLAAINTDKYDVVPVGITAEGRWTLVPVEVAAAMKTVDGQLPTVSGEHPEVVLGNGGVLYRVEGEPGPVATIDVAMSLMHGPYGEDGTIQGLFEMAGIRFVGSGVATSANGMDKALMKTSFARHQIAQGPWQLVTDPDWVQRREQTLARVAELGLPLFVKPARAGSSIGITRVTDLADLPDAIETAREHDPRVVIEHGLTGVREIECAVLQGRDGAPPRPSLLGEVRMLTDGFYDFEAKYLPGEQVALDIPATVEPELEAAAQALAVRTFEAMDAEGLARVDMFALPDGQVLVNEINTMPGFTQYSMYPSLWQATGMSYPELIDELLGLALARPLGLR
ncbi:D-alanine--D-alanine ligase family protein [Propionibacteriaceae bacterium Y1923]|uniref:D-alanine--D-alanine ligase family protein n=1 Tax=Aestuariimicrobium sp. Y1814 TaxID=3418742 RepID=UPI003C27718F